jgi:hypothetical protein
MMMSVRMLEVFWLVGPTSHDLELPTKTTTLTLTQSFSLIEGTTKGLSFDA